MEKSVWEQLIGLYPCLVECTVATSSGPVSRSLREALIQYHDLLRPPGSNSENETENSTSNNNNNDPPTVNGV